MVQFTDLVVTPLGSDAINVAGTASFVIAENTPPISFRLTWVVVREDNDWKNCQPPRVAQGRPKVTTPCLEFPQSLRRNLADTRGLAHASCDLKKRTNRAMRSVRT
jgi:hypothetical protein